MGKKVHLTKTVESDKTMSFKLKHLCFIYPLVGSCIVGCGSGGGASSSTASSIPLTTSSAQMSSSASAANECLDDNGSGYCLIWQDEFQGVGVDSNRWSFEKNCYGGGNNERQCYVDDPQNVWVDGEYLHIMAIAESITGPAVSDDDPNYDANDVSGSGDFSSGRLRTLGKGDWRYGRFEIRAKLPEGQGTWPAIWMLPTDWVFGGWALSGEIDIVEAVNLKVGGEDHLHGTLHFGDAWPDNVYSGTEYQLPDGSNPADDFHVYAVEWEEGEIRWYVDGDHYATQTQDGWYSAAALDQPAAPFNQEFHLILNLAVGGDWAGQVNDTGVDASVFPQELIVDYVRVYQCKHDTQTGRGCATTDDDFVANPGVQPPVIEPVETAQSSLEIFTDAVQEPFYWEFWAAVGEVTYQIVAPEDGGNLIEMQFQSEDGIGYFQVETPLDLRGYSAIEFDVQVVTSPNNDAPLLYFRADCEYPCSSGPIELSGFSIGEWQHIRLELSDLEAAGLNLSSVNTPFVISPAVDNQDGFVLRLDNVELVP